MKTSSPPWRNVGFWLAVLLALSQLGNALRVSFGTWEYSAYMGLPLVSAGDGAWVSVYALRALFLGLFASYLLYARQYHVLSMMALFAIVMPVGDFYLVWVADGATTTLARHALIAIILLAAWFSLRRLAIRQREPAPV